MGFNPCNLGPQPRDALVELLERQRIKVFLAEFDNRLAGFEIVFLVHGSQR